jgi:hypothetical protein
LRPGFLLARGPWPKYPGLKNETWTTHAKSSDCILIFDRAFKQPLEERALR